jgi:CRISPR-associated DxTHG motif protein
MTKKAISFLGYTPPERPYRETTYVFEGQECTSAFMAEATVRFFNPDLLLVLTTPEAGEQNFPDLEARIRALETIPIQPVNIPSGKSEDELWGMFDAIAQQIEQDDEIVFDITNGFRSLPVLAFLAASYIRVVRRAKVDRMVYGAFDASVEGKTPVFDLTPFVKLLDWTVATDAFLKYGRADELKELVIAEAARTSQQPGPTDTLSQIADKLQHLTAALQTSRPMEVMETAHGLKQQIHKNRSKEAASARPFSLLFDKISEEYGRFDLNQPLDQAHEREIIEKQLEMIQWYVNKRLFVQAITLVREWLVSLVIMEEGEQLTTKNHRSRAEKVLRGEKASKHIAPETLSAIQDVWKQTTKVRNDIAHTGMQSDARKAAEVQKEIEAVYGKLQALLPQGKVRSKNEDLNVPVEQQQ